MSNPDLRTSGEIRPLNDLTEKAMDARPELKALQARVSAGQSGVSLAKSGWYPQVYLTGDVYYDNPNQRLLPAQDIFYGTWDIGIALSIPAGIWRMAEHKSNEAEAQLSETEGMLGQMKDGITLELAQDYLNVSQSKRRIAVAQQGVDQAEENYRVTNDKFKAGLVPNTDVIDAQLAELQAKTNYTQTQVDYVIAQALA